ncbi:MAG: XdhC family protein [Desulfobacterales bacterium]|nr:MAG: XdhC family protein [Desulfobacterales bacterium]
MRNIYGEVNKLLTTGKRLVLARIIKQVGSAPRALGTKFIVLEDGSQVGTIGGGSLEYQVSEKAKEVFQKDRSFVLHFRLTGQQVARTEMLCGGIVDVFLEPLSPENSTALTVFRKAEALADMGRKGTLLTLVAEGIDSKAEKCRLLITEDGAVTGSMGDIPPLEASDLQQWIQARKPLLRELHPGTEGLLLFVEPIEPDAVLYLFGAGHVSTFIAPLAKMVGFRVCVIDDRPEFANAERFPNADEFIVCPFADAFQRIAVTAASYVSIITRGHIHDREVLRAALQANPAYIGMIGSQRKRQMIYQSLLDEGIAPERLERVSSPIGLEIGAETPEEIAVSIVAELIQARAVG